MSLVFEWRRAIGASDLSPTDRLVAHVLSTHMNGDGASCFPTLDQLVAETGLHRASVCRSLDALDRRGFVLRDRSRGRHATQYTAIMPKQSQGATVEQSQGATVRPLNSRRVRPQQSQGATPGRTGGRKPKKRRVAPAPQEINRIIVPAFVDSARASGWEPIDEDCRRVGAAGRKLLAAGRPLELVKAAATRAGERNQPGLVTRYAGDIQREQNGHRQGHLSLAQRGGRFDAHEYDD